MDRSTDCHTVLHHRTNWQYVLQDLSNAAHVRVTVHALDRLGNPARALGYGFHPPATDGRFGLGAADHLGTDEDMDLIHYVQTEQLAKHGRSSFDQQIRPAPSTEFVQ